MKYLLILLVGLVLGAGASIFFLGVPRIKSAPGVLIQPPANPSAADTVVISVGSGFFDDLLDTVFRDLGPPAFNLAALEGQPKIATVALQQGCANSITLVSEGSNSRTQVQFQEGKILAPMAFGGSYNLLGNCMQFKGWAQTSIDLRFDQNTQNVYGQLTVDGVTLEGVNPVANNFVTVFVRNAIDQRVNPLELIRAPQLQLMIPVKASNGAVKAHVKDVKAEVLDGVLKLHISYEFSGAKGEPQG
jgi:hypothetical protein